MARRRSWTFLPRFALGAALSMLAANAVADAAGLRWLGIKNQEHLQVVSHFRQRVEVADVAFFGTSVTRNSVVPVMLEGELSELLGRPVRVWNLAVPGGTPEIGLYYVEHLFREGSPDVFVLEAAPFLWNTERKDQEGAETYWRWFAHPIETLLEAPFLRAKYVLRGIEGMNWGWEALWNLPSYHARREVLFSEFERAPRGGRYERRDIDLDWEQPLGEGAFQRAISRVDPMGTGPEWRHMLDRIAELCAEKGVQLLLVGIPMCEELLPEFEPGSYERHRAWMREAAERHGVPYINLHEDPSWRFTLDDFHFRDLIHYSPRGAAVFSQRFAREILVDYLPAAKDAGGDGPGTTDAGGDGGD